ncbi:cell division protein ZipA C-terminal FtsZ-binding domain-containing protein [Basilea psittacipulmonis]|uniref:Cell division protein ZipA n=1 Tax=Basilea psittacipulmonis DSM 24701 TaxID=1072685 RepID=A0A077DE74_9BURK|nr:cell division protein ZipA C-terminal FtsZ-binding domain-containing protein [Basilea psittacipulmonis]AIL32989.1 hypothetical protein IX83_06385 [Basilea psittacipulmonis DSM 24701]
MEIELYIALALLGAVFILLIFMINWWQFYRSKKTQERQKTKLEHNLIIKELVEEQAQDRLIHETNGEDGQLDDNSDIDEFTELIIDINFEKPVKGSDIRAVAKTHFGSKPARYFGYQENEQLDESTVSQVHLIKDNEIYKSVQIAMTMVNREGPFTEIEWSHVCRIADVIAQLGDGKIEFPVKAKCIEQSHKLDEVCASLDAVVTLNLMFTPKPKSDVVQIVLNNGFVESRYGMEWQNQAGKTRFYLRYGPVSEEDEISLLRLQLDVPRCTPDEYAFDRMLGVAQTLSTKLNASIQDDNGCLVNSDNVGDIDEQLRQHYLVLEKAGFAPGSPRTLRVFSNKL